MNFTCPYDVLILQDVPTTFGDTLSIYSRSWFGHASLHGEHCAGVVPASAESVAKVIDLHGFRVEAVDGAALLRTVRGGRAANEKGVHAWNGSYTDRYVKEQMELIFFSIQVNLWNFNNHGQWIRVQGRQGILT